MAAAMAAGCQGSPPSGTSQPAAEHDLIGAWRSQVKFQSGAFAGVRDLEFMYVFNAGGTLTESSNYDGAPPVPPAYGVWRQTGPREFEARYSFYVTRPPAGLDDITKGGGWLPAGRGDIMETITLSPDGKTFQSSLRYTPFEASGKAAVGGGDAVGVGIRMGF